MRSKRNLRSPLWKRHAVLLGSLLAFAALVATGAKAQQKFYLKTGDRVVFYGDSITDQRLYTTLVETYVVTRFPTLKATFVHSGWGGDRVTGGGGGKIDLRLKRDVIAYKPTVMTIMLGMNDAGYQAWNEELYKTYTTGYEHIIDTVKSALPGLRITVIQPSPFDDVTRPPEFEGGYNGVLIRYGQFVKQLGERDGLAVADMNTPVVAMLEKAKEADAELAQKIIPDRVHPGQSGHMIMAEALLKEWKAPATVASVVIDASSRRVVQEENTRVTGLEAAGSRLSWTESDRALPMPISLDDPVVALVIRSSDFVEALDQEPLKVTGLSGARYTLKIDGQEAGRFSKEELEQGINLATLPTPMAKQAAAVHKLTVQHNDVHYDRWRDIQVPLAEIDVASQRAALDALDRLESDLVAKQRAEAQPKPRHFELDAE
jgi:lysophospholipase L1-like esterase